MTTAASLNQRFASDGMIRFREESRGGVIIEVNNHHASATIAMQGAHLMRFQPGGEEPLIWLSPDAQLAEGKSIRGGVPVCWPWFGAHVSDNSLPAHGFARTVPWRLNQVQQLPDGATRLEFELIQTTATLSQWPLACSVRNIITIGKSLKLELVTTNLDREPIVIGEALHTYFHVGDVKRVSVNGLEGRDYLDKVRDFARASQTGPIRFRDEVDRIYLEAPATTEIRDPSLNRRIVIRSQGSHSTVVWNPWSEKSAKMGDMGESGYLNMLCVETANAAQDTVTLAPGAQHRLVARYTIEAL